MAQMLRLCISMAILTAVPVLTEGETKSVRLPNSTVVRIAKWIEVNVDPERDMHGPFVYIAISDNCAQPGELDLFCTISSNELDDATGDGETAGDFSSDGFSDPIDISSSLVYETEPGCHFGRFSLHAEYDGGEVDRVYSIVCDVMDVEDNEVTTVCVVVVSHDKRKKSRWSTSSVSVDVFDECRG